MKQIASSELIINNDGTIFHLHLKPEQLSDKVILVGDPGRVDMVAKHFDSIECQVTNREFRTVTGNYKNKRITVLSTGIGCDNIDIAVNELDALCNIDFSTRTIKEQKKVLDLVRIGTCGGLQPNNPIGTYVLSKVSIGFDGLLYFYAQHNQVNDITLVEHLNQHMNWNNSICIPYAVHANEELSARLNQGNEMIEGITVACGGFYGPQGRQIRLPLTDPEQNVKLLHFRHQDLCVTNFEMESSALSGLAAMLGHHAATCCMIVANRNAKEVNTEYKNNLEGLIQLVLDRI